VTRFQIGLSARGEAVNAVSLVMTRSADLMHIATLQRP
jgi:hypothetical protein